MTVSTIASLTAGVTRALGTDKSKLASSISNLLNPGGGANTASDALSVATSLQAEIASLRIASRNVEQASSLVNVAQGGAQQVDTVLSQLQNLATQASSNTLSADQRGQLSSQFAQLTQQIDQIVNGTQFNGQKLLDGTANPLASSGDASGAIGGLRRQDLFGNATLSLQTADAAQAASQAIAKAQSYVAAQRSNLANLSDGISVASATVQSALQNQDASRSNLNETDLTTALISASTPNLLATYSEQSLRAQTNRLPPSLVQLLGE